MLSLHDIQARVLSALRGHGTALPAVALLRPSATVAAERRLQVYRNNHLASLEAALAAVYPVIARLVGEAFFAQLARAYAQRHPSLSGNLHGFGAQLGAFLRAQEGLGALPYLADVAALEWAAHEVYHEGDGEPVDPAALAAVPEAAQPRLRLHLQLASRFVDSAWPVLAIWQANQPGALDAAEGVSLDAGGVHLLVARREFEVEFRVLGAAEARWLRALGEGRPLAVALATALVVDAGFDLGAVLGRHLSLGTFRGFSLADTEPCR